MTAVILALVLLLLPAAARGDESPAVSGTRDGSGSPAASAAELAASTLPADIASASYYELSAWCRSVGIDDSGSRAELQQRLARHLKVDLPAPAPQAAERTVTVRSAKESQYFTLSDIDEKYVTLTGDVVVEVHDQKSGALHAIRAGRILYNQTLGVVTAEGGVSYTLTRGGKTESFEGASLSFDLETSEAVFYDGRSSKSSTRNGTALTYFFKGDTISRLANDTVVMESGTFTSCDLPEDPHYRIRATKVWILAPGEWAIQNAVLFVGRVPMLYLPVFFWPGDRVVFNPALGYRVREGTYVQTTTYLIGRRETEQDNPLSFLKLEETGATAYDLELHGLFLRKIPVTGTPESAGQSLKLMLDAYSRLGAFVGLAGKFPPLASFTAGLGVSRSLFGNGTSNASSVAWTQFWEGDSSWNTSTILGLEVPFRFGLEGELKHAGTAASVSGRFEYFSDPSFTKDFYARTEGLALTNILDTTIAASSAVAVKSALSWDITSRADLARLLGLPAGVNLTVPTLNANFSWRSKDALYLQTDPKYWDPGKTFYYPERVAFPDVSLALSGELLTLDLSGNQEKAAQPVQPGVPAPASKSPGKAGEELRPPFPVEGSPSGEEEPAQIAPRDPARKSDLALPPRSAGSSLTVSYQVQPRARLDHTFNYEAWDKKEEVDGSIRYRTITTGGTASLSASAALMDRLAEVALGMSVDGNYRLRFDPADILPTNWTDLVLSDYQQDRFALRSTIAATVRPFLSIPQLAGSTVSYRLGWRLYQLAFTGSVAVPEFTPSVFTWSPSTVAEHSLQSTFQLAAFGQTDSLSLSCQLPPLDTVLTGQLVGGVGTWKARLQGGVREVADALQVQPLILSQSVLLGGALTVSEDLQFLSDPASPSLDRSVSQVSGWGASASFTIERLLPVVWDGAAFQWIPSGIDKVLLPSTARLAYTSQATPQWLWKDRIRLEGSASTAWNVNLQRTTDSTFDFSLRLSAAVSQFLEVSFASVSNNNKTYRYIPGWAEEVGEAWVNPLGDLAASFNFWNISDRYRSGFKIRTLSIKAVHHLHDWDLSFEYQGSPQLRVLTGGLRQYEWIRTFGLFVQWVPVPEVRSRIRYNDLNLSPNKLTLRG